jgi:hypothetical protein
MAARPARALRNERPAPLGSLELEPVVFRKRLPNDPAEVLEPFPRAFTFAVGQPAAAEVEDLAPEIVDCSAPALLRQARLELNRSSQGNLLRWEILAVPEQELSAES